MSKKATDYYKQRIQMAGKTLAILYKYPTLMKKALLSVKLKDFKILYAQAEKILEEAETAEKDIRDFSSGGDKTEIE